MHLRLFYVTFAVQAQQQRRVGDRVADKFDVEIAGLDGGLRNRRTVRGFGAG